MAKRIKVGPRYRKGLLLRVEGELKWFAPGELLPEQFNEEIPGRFFRDKRAIWVDTEEKPVKKASPKPKPSPKAKKENADKSASPSPSSEGAGASAPAPLEVKGEQSEKSAESKPKRKRKKLFSSD